MILRRLLPTTAGAALGLLPAFVAGRILRSFLYDVPPTDAAVYAVVAGTVGAVARLASWLPARRAARVDPPESPREE